MITWMTGKNSMKHYYLKWKIFKVTLNMEDMQIMQMQIMRMQKKFGKNSK